MTVIRLIFIIVGLILSELCSALTVFENMGLCSLVSSTNIGLKASYSNWTCLSDGATPSGNPCGSWNGITCNGNENVVSIRWNSPLAKAYGKLEIGMQNLLCAFHRITANRNWIVDIRYVPQL